MQPFACAADPAFTALLEELGCSLVLSSYQAGKLIVLAAASGRLVQLPRDFRRPMGLAVDAGRLAVAAGPAVELLVNAPELAPGYPNAPGSYDALYLPRASYHCGPLDLHDMAFCGPDLLAVNTRCSCLCLIDAAVGFTALWRPPFISAIVPEDRCHLNGMAMGDSAPRYVTALAAADTSKGYRPHKLHGGVILRVPDGAQLAGGLAMPHSPRLVGGRLLVLLSALGELAEVDQASGKLEVIARLPAFVRGLASSGDHLFVGMSRLRPDRPLGDIPLAQAELWAGVAALHLPSGRLVGALRYLRDVEEIYDVQVLPGVRRPGIVGVGAPLAARAIVTPDASFWLEEGAG